MKQLLPTNISVSALLFRMGMLGTTILFLSFILTALVPSPAALAATRNAARPTSGSGALVYVHTATAANIMNNWTDLNNTVTNNNPDAVIFVTPNKNPTSSTGVFDNHPIGVWYHNGAWAIFNQDLAVMPVGASFNVYALPQADTSDVFVQTATKSNITNDYTTIDNPLSNGQKDMILLVTPVWNPGQNMGIFNNHPLGVWYHDGTWVIFNQDKVAMPPGASFNVVILQKIVFGTSVHTATRTNITNNRTNLNTAITNKNPNALVFITPNLTPQKVFNNHNTGVEYHNGIWAIFNQDLATMPVGASFNVVAFSQPVNP